MKSWKPQMRLRLLALVLSLGVAGVAAGCSSTSSVKSQPNVAPTTTVPSSGGGISY